MRFELERALGGWRDEVARTGALTVDDLDELEDHLRSVHVALLDTGLSPADAFAHAREAVGTPAALAVEYRKTEEGGWRYLLGAAATVFAVSFLLPVDRWDVPILGPDTGVGIRGFEAFWLALGGEAGAVGVASALTNIAFLTALFRPERRSLGGVAVLAGALLGSVVLNLWWVWQAGVVELQVGYWAWVGAFAAAGGAFVQRARELSRRAVALLPG